MKSDQAGAGGAVCWWGGGLMLRGRTVGRITAYGRRGREGNMDLTPKKKKR